MSNIDLLLDEENELTFSLTIEGTRPAEAQCRLVVESQDLSLVFDSVEYNGDEVTVVLPPLKHVLKEGEYNMDLEVIVEDKYFKPLTMVGNFEKSLEIKAKPMIRSKKKEIKPTVTLSEVKVKRKPLRPVVEKSQKRENAVNRKKKTKVTDKQILQIIEALSNGNLND